MTYQRGHHPRCQGCARGIKDPEAHDNARTYRDRSTMREIVVNGWDPGAA